MLLFLLLYTSVPTNDTKISYIHAEIDDRINWNNVCEMCIIPVVINKRNSQLQKSE